MKLEDFNYCLPEELIALQPLKTRRASKMLVLNENKISDHQFSNLENFLNPGDLLVCNNSKVIPAQLNLQLNSSNVSIQLNKQLGDTQWSIFAKPGKKIKVGEKYSIAEDFNFYVEKKLEDGQIIVNFFYEENFYKLLDKYGDTPLPPYIRKLHKTTQLDKENYQTVYAEHSGSVAAPTAGLHFDQVTIDKLTKKGINIAYITLHVGGGTFLPIKTDNIQNHKIHSEYCEISKEVADLINKTKRRGNKVIAIGTTSMRSIEFSSKDGICHPYSGETNLYITPGYKFQIFDKMITNFHLPKSSLLVLVSAFSGYKNIMSAYKHAVENKYRFFSYGDCCLLNRYE
ncbi:MAG: tRNA preQ1(34) S-adenosylmethionine ribosyltransferase-isomerase QueA [Rickettsiales bacterium]